MTSCSCVLLHAPHGLCGWHAERLVPALCSVDPCGSPGSTPEQQLPSSPWPAGLSPPCSTPAKKHAALLQQCMPTPAKQKLLPGAKYSASMGNFQAERPPLRSQASGCGLGERPAEHPLLLQSSGMLRCDLPRWRGRWWCALGPVCILQLHVRNCLSQRPHPLASSSCLPLLHLVPLHQGCPPASIPNTMIKFYAACDTRVNKVCTVR